MQTKFYITLIVPVTNFISSCFVFAAISSNCPFPTPCSVSGLQTLPPQFHSDFRKGRGFKLYIKTRFFCLSTELDLILSFP